MGGVILCGRRTTKPYCIEGAGVNIYSIEELCYYLYNNVYMIGADFFTEELVKFIAEELELPALGQRLKQKKGSKSDVTSMVMDVMSATAYYSREECKNVEENIKKFGNMSKPERMKVKADLLVERKRYVSALLAYKELLDNRDELYNGEFVASIWNSMGVVYAKQFLFNDALKCFKTACDIDWKEQYVKNMISATVFAKDEDAMENVVTQYQVTDNALNEYMNSIENAKNELVKQSEISQIKESLKYDGGIELKTFNDGVSNLLNDWKEEYRHMNT